MTGAKPAGPSIVWNMLQAVTPRDLEVWARTVYGEARGLSWLGMVAVAWSVRTRAEADLHGDGKPDWWGEGIAGVCLRPYQYSCWNPADPNRPKLLNVSAENAAFRQCLAVVAAVATGLAADPTHRATHYFNPRAVANRPAWADVAEFTGEFDGHLFYRNVA